jgi:hypothetical protein
MAGWYAARGLYRSEELGGLSLTRFVQAVSAEGCSTHRGANFALHTHPLLNTADVYGHGKPTRIANAAHEVRQPEGSLPVSEAIGRFVFGVPWFKHYRPVLIDEYANAFRKAAESYQQLLEDDPGDGVLKGGSSLTFRR